MVFKIGESWQLSLKIFDYLDFTTISDHLVSITPVPLRLTSDT